MHTLALWHRNRPHWYEFVLRMHSPGDCGNERSDYTPFRILTKKYFFDTLYGMGKIYEVKEILNTLRVAMSIFFGLFVLIVGKLVSLYTNKDFSELFWMSIAAAVLNIVAIVLIIRKIAAKTKEIRDL